MTDRDRARERLAQADQAMRDPTRSPLTAHAVALLALAHAVLVLADAIVAGVRGAVDGDGTR